MGTHTAEPAETKIKKGSKKKQRKKGQGEKKAQTK
jgi:hypothetical protein